MKFNSLFKKHNIILKLLLIGALSVAFGIGAYFVIVGWAFPGFSLGAEGRYDWSLLEGFASAISVSLLAGGLIFAVTEYINTENAQHNKELEEEREKAKLDYDIYRAIFEKFTAPEQEAARRWILSNIAIKKEDEDIDAWYRKTNAKIMKVAGFNKRGIPEGQQAVKLVLNCFDYIGFIANHYWKIQGDSLDWISPPVAKVWRRLGPYVGHVRTLRKSADYYVSAEQFGILCIKSRQDKGLLDEEYAKNTL